MKLKEVAEQYPDFVDEVNKRLLQKMKDNPDFQYNTSDRVAGCSYNGPAVRDGKQCGPDCNGCIFGQVLQEMGWDDKDELRFCDSIDYLMRYHILPCDDVWINIQHRQDNGVKWGDLIHFFGTEAIDIIWGDVPTSENLAISAD